MPRHYLSELDLSADEFRGVLRRASELKILQREGQSHETLKNKVLAMIFEKSSTRTRVSFETGMAQLGGHALFLSPHDTQLGRGEPIDDTAKVLSQMVDAVMIRTAGHDIVDTFAATASVPVINGLSDLLHPCQLLADMQTCFEHRGDIADKRVAWVGDGNNMCNSYMQTAKLLGFDLYIACPTGYEPDAGILADCANNVELANDPKAVCSGADIVVTDAWVSMGQESEQQARCAAFADFQVDAALLALAKPDALFLHCLPAYRGKEVTDAVIDGPQSVVWDEAGNRLHAQKALLEFLLGSEAPA
ncbi:MAG: ornithine carbamoyltransferase [Pseudomonadota bacterium]